MKVLSLGAGVNSTALLVLKAEGKVNFDLAIFADTGCEHPETYEYIEKVIKPFCQKHNIQLAIVKREGKNLYEQFWEWHMVPLRRYRICTDHFKIRVIRKYLCKNYGNEQITTLLGIDAGEAHRAKENCGNEYPLIEMGIDRDKCKQIIKDASLPIPIKSGCYVCPFQKVRAIKWLKRKHPDLFQKAVLLEKNGQHYPKMTIKQGKTLEEVVSKTEMCDYLGDSCAFCEIE